MPSEIELKLGLAESDQQRLMRLPLLRQESYARQTIVLGNIYYDTAGLALHRRGIALRLRKSGQHWLQTVKCAGVSAGGLSERPEWESAYTGHFDFSAITDKPVRDWLNRPKIRSRLLPVFETNFRRTIWTFGKAKGCHILVMLDRGWIAAAGSHLPISELELELQSGPVDQVFALAEKIARFIPLQPVTESKAERGYRLFLGYADVPRKAAAVELGGNECPREAFRRIAFACLEQLQSNQRGAMTSDDPEYIHQMRVALRRLRAALRLFRPCLEQDFEARILPSLRNLMLLLGEARDLDVLLTEVTSPVSRALPDEPRLAMLGSMVTEFSHVSRQAVRRLLAETDHGLHLIQISRLVHRVSLASTTTSPMSLAVFARRRLHKLHRRVSSLATAADRNDPASLHALRIAVKRLRYAMEFLGPLYGRRRTALLLKQLVHCQDWLGQLNDLASAGERLMQCAGNDPKLREAVALIGGWHGTRYRALLDGIPEMLTSLRRLRLPQRN